jgi:hypothetical protein
LATDADYAAVEAGKKAYAPPVVYKPMELPADFWQTTFDTDVTVPVIPTVDPSASETSSQYDTYLKQLSSSYQDLQNELTLMDYEGWAQRRKEVELWAIDTETTLNGLDINDTELTNLLALVTKSKGVKLDLIDKEEIDASNTAIASYSAILDDLYAKVGAMQGGAQSFALFEKTKANVEEITLMTKYLNQVEGATPEWIKVQIEAYTKWLNLIPELSAEIAIRKDYIQLLDDTMTSAMSQMSATIVSNLMDGENAFKSFGDLAISIIEQVIAEVMRLAVIQPIVKGLMGAFGYTSVTASAKGNVFGSSGLIPYKKGGVVSSPTIFPFANGTGLMGEEGPEGILPLSRSVNGDLGVTAVGLGNYQGGSSGPVVINIINKGEQMKVDSQTKSKGSNGETVIDVMVSSAIKRLDGKGQLDSVFARHGSVRTGRR